MLTSLRAPFTLKQLEAFYTAATLPSFNAAARQLHLSQSSLSKRINELESSINVKLFDRSGHRASLTTAGRRLLPAVRELIDKANAIPHTADQTPALQGACRYGMGELAAVTWLPRLMAQGRQQFPELSLEPHIDLGQVLERRLSRGELDFAVVAGWSSHPELASHTIAEVSYSWAGAPSLVGDLTTVTADILHEIPVITMPAEAGSTRIFDAWATANNLDIPKRVVCNNMGAIAGMVAAGVGIGYFPEGWLRTLIQRGTVRLLASDPPLQTLHYSFQWRRNDIRPLIPAMRELVTASVDFTSPHPIG